MKVVEGNENQLEVLKRFNVLEEEDEGVSLRSDDGESDSDSNSSYLQYCTDEESEKQSGHLLLVQSEQSSVNHHQFSHIDKKIIDDFSTSEFQSSLQKQPQNNTKNPSNHNDITTFNQSQLTKYIAIESNCQQPNNNLHDDTLDLSEMLDILDECEKRHRSSRLGQGIRLNKQNIKTIQQEKYRNDKETLKKGSRNTNQQQVRESQHRELIKDTRKKSFIPNHQLSYPPRRQQKIFLNSSPYYPLKKTHSQPFTTINNQNRLQQFASENYLFWGVRVSLKLSSFMKLSKNVLVVPFSNSQFSDPVSQIVNSKIKYNMKEILLKQAAKCKEKQVPNGRVFSVKAKGLENNYRGIYFMKIPQDAVSQGLKYYQTSLMKKSINSIFSLLDTHNQNHIVFPQFHWPSFTTREISEILIGSIFREINQNRKSHKCQYLREVVICASNCELFELYLRYFRFFVGKMDS